MLVAVVAVATVLFPVPPGSLSTVADAIGGWTTAWNRYGSDEVALGVTVVPFR